MDESKLLEECISVNFTPLETILLSKTVVVVHALIDWLRINNCMDIEKVTEDNVMAPDEEQTGGILIKSALEALQEARTKIWENGSKEIGTEVPEEFEEVLGVYTIVLEQMAYKFLESLRER